MVAALPGVLGAHPLPQFIHEMAHEVDYPGALRFIICLAGFWTLGRSHLFNFFFVCVSLPFEMKMCTLCLSHDYLYLGSR